MLSWERMYCGDLVNLLGGVGQLDLHWFFGVGAEWEEITLAGVALLGSMDHCLNTRVKADGTIA